jgi:ATP-dependent 26S proteasome regulatory subunit
MTETVVINSNWSEANQRYLLAALAIVRQRLEARVSGQQDAASTEMQSLQDALHEAAAALPGPPALDTLSVDFELSPFERDILLLCAGVELDATFASLCGAAQGNSARTYPTFSLALAALPESHWSALTPATPLRYWRLIEVSSGSGLTLSPLHIDERILHYLSGVQYLDQRLASIIDPFDFRKLEGQLVPSHQMLADQIVKIWSHSGERSIIPVIQLCGDDILARSLIVAQACKIAGLNLCTISTYALPTSPGELDDLIRLWERESILSANALLLNCDELVEADGPRMSSITRFIERTRGVLIITHRERRTSLQRSMFTFEVHKPTQQEQQAVWQSVLGSLAQQLHAEIPILTSQFSLSASTIQVACTEALMREEPVADNDSTVPLVAFSDTLWEICRMQARPRIDDLAQRIEPAATWQDLILPEAQMQTLRTILTHVRHRSQVYETWGFATKSARTLGISALFTGASGTGKTMAAEVLANELKLDLYRIDLSQVVSKYIGETEKNLRRIFDVAEEGGMVLLFDEADALFGKRSEVKDSHDRYANIEVSYLLQRMETYRGLAILTTNMKSALDTAFLRRIRFLIQFPFPDATQRVKIWQQIFPANTPTEGLNMTKMARLNIAGGNIRNIAMNAAFLAADTGEPVGMIHVLRSARSEYAKLEKPLTEVEIGGWT